jgi:hypothetical protein
MHKGLDGIGYNSARYEEVIEMLFELLKEIKRRPNESTDAYLPRLVGQMIATASDLEFRIRRLEGREPLFTEEEKQILIAHGVPPANLDAV